MKFRLKNKENILILLVVKYNILRKFSFAKMVGILFVAY